MPFGLPGKLAGGLRGAVGALPKRPGLGPSPGMIGQGVGGMMNKFMGAGPVGQKPMQPQIRPEPPVPQQTPSMPTMPAAPPPEQDMQSMAGAMGQQGPAGPGLGPQQPALQNMMSMKRQLGGMRRGY